MEQKFYWTAKLFADGKAIKAKYFETEEERNRYVEEHEGWLKRGKICAENLEKNLHNICAM